MKGKKFATAALAALILGTSVGSLAACGGPSELVYWCFDADMAKQVTDYYDTEERNLGYDIKVEVVPLDQMLSRLDNAFRSGKTGLRAAGRLPCVRAMRPPSHSRSAPGGRRSNSGLFLCLKITVPNLYLKYHLFFDNFHLQE